VTRAAFARISCCASSLGGGVGIRELEVRENRLQVATPLLGEHAE
jgi:hypothetical protein